MENLKKLKYVEQVQNETTRIYGPGTGIFARQAQQDYFIGNIKIKRGHLVSYQPLANHHSEKYYKNPK